MCEMRTEDAEDAEEKMAEEVGWGGRGWLLEASREEEWEPGSWLENGRGRHGGHGGCTRNRVAVRHDDGGLEQIMVVVSLSFREVFSSRANRTTAQARFRRAGG